MEDKKLSMQEIVEQMRNFSLTDLTNLQFEQIKIRNERVSEFVSSIQDSDTKRLKELFLLEVDFKDRDLWQKLFKVNLSQTDKETIDYLMNLDMQLKPISGNVFSGLGIDIQRIADVKQDALIDPVIVLKKFIKAGMEKSLMYGRFTEAGFKTARSYFETQKFFVVAQHAIKNFANFPSIEGYESVHSYIKQNEALLVPILFNNIKSEENLESFLNNAKYKNFLENGIKLGSSETVMAMAMSESSLAKITTLHKIGVKFPESKPPYSSLFQKTSDDAIPSQRYVIRNVDDITFANQIILKTLLHSSRNGDKEELIKEALERYSSEQIELLPEALKKREPKQEVLLVKKFYDYHMLKKEISDDSENPEKPRMKI